MRMWYRLDAALDESRNILVIVEPIEVDEFEMAMPTVGRVEG